MHRTPVLPSEALHADVSSVRPAPRPRLLARSAALLLGLTLGAAACGSSSDSPDTSAAGSSSEAISASSDGDANDGASNDGASNDDASSDAAADAGASTENLFPDVNVLSISDGATLNLSEELSGGDTAVLLWFFAPH